MIFDKQNQFSWQQDLSQTAATYPSTNVIDLGVDRDIGKGEPIPILIKVIEAFVGSGATVQVLLETDDNAAHASAETLWDSGAIGVATLVAGYEFLLNFIPRTNQRYLRLTYTIATATTTAGTISAGIHAGLQTNEANV